jgi:hypothetical protein
MIDIEDVKRLNLGPNDILVAQVKGIISSQARDRIKEQFDTVFPALKNRVMVIDENITLAVLLAEEAKLRA